VKCCRQSIDILTGEVNQLASSVKTLTSQLTDADDVILNQQFSDFLQVINYYTKLIAGCQDFLEVMAPKLTGGVVCMLHHACPLNKGGIGL